jgi:DNA-binding transcriptional regulator YiaG
MKSRYLSNVTPRQTAALAAAIHLARKNAGMTQVQFAAHLGVSQQRVSGWEKRRGLRTLVVAMELIQFIAKHARGA